MAQADGYIIIDTEINADGMKAGSKEVEAAVRRMANSVDDMGNKAKTALNKQADAFAKLNNEYAAQEQKVSELKKKIAEYGEQKVPTDEYREIQTQISQATQKLNSLKAAQDKFLSTGGKQSSSSFKRMQYDIEELENEIKYAKAELADLEASGGAFTLDSKTQEAAASMRTLQAEERKLADMNNRLHTSYNSVKGSIDDYKQKLMSAAPAQQKMANASEKASKSITKTGKAANSARFGIGRMLKMSLLMSIAFRAFSAAISAIKDGFTNLAQYSSSTNNSISMLWGSLETLKNSLATAFAPILSVVAPILSKFIDMLSTAASYVSMFFSFLSGKSTYTKAIAVQKDYAGSLKDTASGAKDAADGTKEAAEAAEEYLSPLDDINKMDKQDSGSDSGGSGGGGGGAGGGSGSGPLFEEVPIDNKFASLLDSVLDKLKQIRDIFMDGFWDGLGDYKPVLEELKKDLKSIGEHIKDIFTDKNVQEAAKRFAILFIYNMGKTVGSFVSIGLTIAANVVGGIESYLEENTDRIKKWLVRMFDLGSEISIIVGNLSATIAEIFQQTFGSQTAQNITGNIIGIFTTAFGEIILLATSFAKDVMDAIATPIIENKDKIIEAINNTLKPIEEITQSIEDFVQKLADKLTELYDEHIGPFINDVGSGLSEIGGTLLDTYNQYIAPILDQWAQKFDEVLNGPVGDAIDHIIDEIGRLIDGLNWLWNNVLIPLIQWLIENVIPVLAPIVAWIGDTLLSIVASVTGMADSVLKQLDGIIQFLTGVFTGDWAQALSGILLYVEGFKQNINIIFNFIKNQILDPLSKWLDGVFKVDWVKDFGVIGDYMNAWLANIQNIVAAVKQAFSGIVDFVNGVLSGDWQQAWDGIKNIFGGAWNGMLAIIKSPINGIIGLMNGLLRAAQIMQKWTTVPFEFEDSPMNKIVMIHTPDGFNGVYFLGHHMVVDAQSLIAFLKDIIEIYLSLIHI